MKRIFAALFVVLFTTGLLPPAARSAGTDTGAYEVIANAFGFGIDIPGCADASKNIREIGIDDLEIDVREVTTGNDVDYRLYGPGAAHWGSATITTACTLGGSKELQDWFEAARGKNIRKNITVTLFKSDKSPGRSYVLHDCLPTWWSQQADPISGECTNSIVVQIGFVEFISYGGQVAGRKPVTPPSNSGGPSPDETHATQGFRVEITGAGGKERDSAWESVSGGELIIEQTETTVGSDKFQTSSPGHKTVGELTLRGAMTDKRDALCTWINETANGKPWKRNLTITELLSVDGAVKDGKAYEYVDAFPIRYCFPRLSTHAQTGNAGEKVDLHLTRIAHELPPHVSGQIDIPNAPFASKGALLIAIDDMAMNVANVKNTGDAHEPTATIALPCGWGGELEAWYREALQGQPFLRNISIALARNEKPTGQTYTFVNCFPINFQPGDCTKPAGASVDTLTVKVGRIELR